MATLVLRSTKGSPLTSTELDNNFNNLNSAKYETGTALGTPLTGNLTNCTGYTWANLAGTLNRLNLGSTSGQGQRSMFGQATLDLTALDQATYYPVTIQLPFTRTCTLRIEVGLNSGSLPTWRDHPNGFALFIEWTVNGSGYGTLDVLRTIRGWNERWVTPGITIVGGITQMTNSSNEVIYLRGGGIYFFSADIDVTPVIRTTSYTTTLQTVAPSTTIINVPTNQGTANIGAGSLTLSGNTILGSASTNTLNVGNGGLVKDASGNVGIGTASPSGKLHVTGTSGNLLRVGTEAGNGSTDFWPVVIGDGVSSGGGGTNQNFVRIGRFTSGTAGIDAFQGGVGGAPLAFGTFGTERMRIDSNGNLLVGTTTQPQRFVSSGSFANTDTAAPYSNILAKFENTNRTANNLTTMMFAGRTAGAVEISTSGISSQVTNWTDGAVAANMLFYTAATSIVTEKMRITSAGNVGIGFTNPTYKLTVNGTGYIETSLNIGGGGGSSDLNIMNTNTPIQMVNATNTNQVNLDYTDAQTFTLRTYHASGSNLTFGTAPSGGANAERMRINSVGNVGIGTNAPNTKLELRTDTNTAGSEPNILIQNRGLNNTTPNTNPYYVGGIFGAGLRDVRDPAYIAGIDFYRDSASAGLASNGSIRFYASNGGGTLAELRAGGDEKVRIDSAGNLLVGATSPNFSVAGRTEIEVKGASSSFFTLTSSSTFNAYYGGDNTGITLATVTAIPLVFATNSTERMRLDANGDLGIGVTDPTATLHLKAGTASAATAPLKFTSGTNLSTVEAGVIEYDGVVKYFTNDTTSGRGFTPTTQIFRLTANGTTSTQATAANFFGTTSAINLAANGVYEIEAYCYFLKTTAGTVTVTPTLTVAPVFLSGTVQYGALVGGTASGTSNQINLIGSTAIATAFGTSGSLTTGVNHLFIVKLIVEAGATNSNLRFNFTSVTGTHTPLRGSYYKVTRLPASNTGSFAA